MNENYKELNLAQQKKDSKSHYKNYRKLIELRKGSPVLKSGSVQTIATDDVLIIVRATSNQTILLVINFKDSQNATINILDHLDGLNRMGVVLVATLKSPIQSG